MRRRGAFSSTMRTSGDEQPRRRRRLGRGAAERLLDAARGPAAGNGGTADTGRDTAFVDAGLDLTLPGALASSERSGTVGSAGSAELFDADLGRLLSAAAGPALAGELSGEAAARAAYLAAHRPGPPTKENRVFSKLMLSKALAVKIGAACLGVSAAGVATAAETGTLPSGLQKSAHSAFGGVGVPSPGAKQKDKDAHESAAQAAGTTKSTGSAAGTTTPKPTGTADADDKAKKDRDDHDGDGAVLLGGDAGWLCRAAANGDRDDKGADLGAAELQKLAKAAGIPADQVAELKTRLDAEQAQAQQRIQDFCTRLDAAMKAVKEGKVPSFPLPPIKPGPGWPSGWPTTWPSGLPTGLPSSWPSDWPSRWPTGLPSGLPTKLPSGVPSLPVPTGLPSHLPSGVPSLPLNPIDPIHVPSGPQGSVSVTVHH
jgi:hypothetical protein